MKITKKKLEDSLKKTSRHTQRLLLRIDYNKWKEIFPEEAKLVRPSYLRVEK